MSAEGYAGIFGVARRVAILTEEVHQVPQQERVHPGTHAHTCSWHFVFVSPAGRGSAEADWNSNISILCSHGILSHCKLFMLMSCMWGSHREEGARVHVQTFTLEEVLSTASAGVFKVRLRRLQTGRGDCINRVISPSCRSP